jgi:hypothetical protein
MALESTQPITEMNTRNLPGGKGRPARGADLTAICAPIVWKMWEPRYITTLWARPVQRGARDILSWRPILLCRL